MECTFAPSLRAARLKRIASTCIIHQMLVTSQMVPITACLRAPHSADYSAGRNPAAWGSGFEKAMPDTAMFAQVWKSGS